MVQVLRTFPFTILMLTVVVSFAIATRTHLGPLSPSIRKAHGFAPIHLPQGEWTRLISSAFFTVGGLNFYATLIMMIAGLGAAEVLYGTGRTIALFWGIHLATLLLGSLLLSLPLHALDVYHGTLLANERDVGPSAGYYGCLGAASNAIPARWRVGVMGLILMILLARLVWSSFVLPDQGRALSADLSHIIAFPLGILAASLVPLTPHSASGS